MEGWTDAYEDDCSWYESNDSPGCPLYGSLFPNEDLVDANAACCYCKDTDNESSPSQTIDESSEYASSSPSQVINESSENPTNPPSQTIDESSEYPSNSPSQVMNESSENPTNESSENPSNFPSQVIDCRKIQATLLRE